MYDYIHVYDISKLHAFFYVLALEKKNGCGEKKICLKYIRSVQRLFEGEKVTKIIGTRTEIEATKSIKYI